nr:FAD:protein FMN transferase [Candidatus Aminicenantes bacterium]
MKKDKQSISRSAHFAMGTTFEVVISGEEKTYARQASQEIFNEIDRIENLFSRFNPCSDIGQINRLKSGQSLRIGIETYECLKTAAQIHSLTSGAFDVNIGSLT